MTSKPQRRRKGLLEEAGAPENSLLYSFFLPFSFFGINEFYHLLLIWLLTLLKFALNLLNAALELTS